ncbi:MAG: phosphoenolpyruvate--protein phosphotransferase [Candidatus Methylomirabilia bacterium]
MSARKKDPLGVATLEDIGRLILHSHDLDETLRNVADLVARRAGTDVCSIYLVAEDGETLELRASHGLAKKAVGRVSMKVGEGLTGLVVRERRIVALREPQEHPLYRYFKETGEERFHSFFGIPLLDRGEPVGVLVLQTREPRDYTAAETSALSSIAYQVAAIVVNARLLDTVRRTEDAARRYSGELVRLRRGGAPAGEEGRGKGVEQLLRGAGTSPGFAQGAANLMDEQQHPVETADAAPADPTGESARLEKALEETRVQTILLEKQVAGRLAEAEAGIFHTHLMVLEDRGFLDKLHREVARGHGSATAVKMAVAEYLEAFGRMEDPYLRERAADIRDIGRRILAHLAGRGTPDPALSADGILVAAELLPSDMAALDPTRVRGIVTERGEPTSHAAIMARSLGIPALMGVKGALRGIASGNRLILDANSGCVYINPGELVAAEYRRLEVERRREGDFLEGLRDRPALSLDRVRVTLRANIGLISDVDVALRNGADGVGLYRSEFPYMVREDFPDREDQYRLYRHVVERFGGAPVTIRTLDVGGDKHLPYAVQAHEENPFMGLRSVRYTLENPEIFRTQIEAILMAGAHGPVRILFPLITSLDEVRRCKAVVAQARESLTREGVAFGQEVPLGIMIEVPAAVWQAPAFAVEVDFFSVGTNDLVQYLLAADRTNPLVSRYYDHLHPAVLAALRHVAEAARREDSGLSICGEMAADPRAFLLLFGLGYREFSLPAPFIPRMKQLLAGISSAVAAETAAECLRQGDASRVATLLDEALARIHDSR